MLLRGYKIMKIPCQFEVLVLTQLPVEMWVVQPQFGNVGGSLEVP